MPVRERAALWDIVWFRLVGWALLALPQALGVWDDRRDPARLAVRFAGLAGLGMVALGFERLMAHLRPVAARHR